MRLVIYKRRGPSRLLLIGGLTLIIGFPYLAVTQETSTGWLGWPARQLKRVFSLNDPQIAIPTDNTLAKIQVGDATPEDLLLEPVIEATARSDGRESMQLAKRPPGLIADSKLTGRAPSRGKDGSLTVYDAAKTQPNQREAKSSTVIKRGHFPPEWQLERPFPTDAGDIEPWKRKAARKRQDWQVDGPTKENEDFIADDDVDDGIEAEEPEEEEEEKPKLDPGSYRAVRFDPGLSYFGRQVVRRGRSLHAAAFVRRFSNAEIDTMVRPHADFIGPGNMVWESLPEAQRDKVVAGRVLSLGHYHRSDDELHGVVIFEIVGGYVEDGDGADLAFYNTSFEVNAKDEEYVDAELAAQYDAGDTFIETGVVGVAESLEAGFVEIPCASKPVEWIDKRSGKKMVNFPGCIGVKPTRIGGDWIDLAQLGDKKPRQIRFIRIRDEGHNNYLAKDGTEGFDLDALVIINGVSEVDMNNLI